MFFCFWGIGATALIQNSRRESGAVPMCVLALLCAAHRYVSCTKHRENLLFLLPISSVFNGKSQYTRVATRDWSGIPRTPVKNCLDKSRNYFSLRWAKGAAFGNRSCRRRLRGDGERSITPEARL